jgi:drug/metabolite transporter (DMT)-like permease
MSLVFGLGEALSVGCALVWALAVILFKKSGESLEPFALNLVKNALVLPLFALTVLVFDGPHWPDIPPGDVAFILVSGFLGIAVGDTLYFRALNTLGAGHMAALQTLYSPFVILLSLAFLGEHLNLVQFGGVVLVLAGIALVSLARSPQKREPGAIWRGTLWGAAAVFFMAVGVVTAKPMLNEHNFWWVVSLRIVAGFGGMVIIAAWRRQFAGLARAYRAVRQWPVIFAGALTGTYLSTFLWLAGYKYTQASIAAVLNETAAIFILMLSVVLLREHVNLRQWCGTLLAVLGVFLVVLR